MKSGRRELGKCFSEGKSFTVADREREARREGQEDGIAWGTINFVAT